MSPNMEPIDLELHQRFRFNDNVFQVTDIMQTRAEYGGHYSQYSPFRYMVKIRVEMDGFAGTTQEPFSERVFNMLYTMEQFGLLTKFKIMNRLGVHDIDDRMYILINSVIQKVAEEKENGKTKTNKI